MTSLLLLIATVAGCQSFSGRSSDVALLSNASSQAVVIPAKFPLPTRTSQEVRKKVPVRLTGLVAEDPTDPGEAENADPNAIPATKQDLQSATVRDIRPIYFGQQGIRDPHGPVQAGSSLRQTSGEEEPARQAKPGLLLGDDPEKLFRGLDAQDTPAGSEGDPFQSLVNSAPGDNPALPQFLTPQPTATETAAANASPYEQALNAPPERLSITADFNSLIPSYWSDLKAIATWQNAAFLAVAAGGAVAIRETGVDNAVRNNTLQHEDRWGGGSQVLRQFGEPTYQVPVLAGFYAYTLCAQDFELHDYSRALIHGYAINGVATVVIKGIADTTRPTPEFSDGRWGFPSFHTGSLFSIGGVTEEYYGWKVSVPIYIVGGLVGWSRIDQREHDLSDVLFGAALGYVIGKSVGANHRATDGRRQWNVQPYYDPQNGVNGVTMETKF